MEWNLQFQQLVNHNEDIRKLIEKGYAVSLDSNHLVIRDIPYLNERGELKIGAIVSKLVDVDKRVVKQHNHEIFFCGSHPCESNATKIPNLGGSTVSISLEAEDIKVERSFSNKPVGRDGFKDHFEKIESYTALFSGPAMEKFPKATPFTFNVYDSHNDSFFKFNDTLTSRAEIGDLARKFKEDVIAIIGLGGTGSYVLDFLSKTPVQEIRGFDNDDYHVHNAFRSPGVLVDDELGKSKAEVYQKRYEQFRHGIKIEKLFISSDSYEQLSGVTFAFVCVDKGSARAKIFELLLALKIPFIDVGVGLDRDNGKLNGMIRTSFYSAENGPKVAEKKLAPMAEYPDDEYRTNIQIAELNALNASLAVLKYKQVREFYSDSSNYYAMLFDIGDSRNVGENEL